MHSVLEFSDEISTVLRLANGVLEDPVKNRPVVTTPAEGRTISLVGDIYRFLVVGEETGGRYALFEATVPPGGGPPPHRHSREEEGFYVLEGEVTVQVDDQHFVAGIGTFANMPVGSLHCFKNESGKPASMLIFVAPAGLEKMFLEVGQGVVPGTRPLPPSREEIEKLLAVAPQ